MRRDAQVLVIAGFWRSHRRGVRVTTELLPQTSFSAVLDRQRNIGAAQRGLSWHFAPSVLTASGTWKLEFTCPPSSQREGVGGALSGRSRTHLRTRYPSDLKFTVEFRSFF